MRNKFHEPTFHGHVGVGLAHIQPQPVLVEPTDNFEYEYLSISGTKIRVVSTILKYTHAL